jgi:uncharacterized cupin superfamily protein
VTGSVIRLEPGGPAPSGLEFWGNCDSEEVTWGEPVETGHEYFANASGALTSGVWECTAYTAEFDAYPVDEFCHIHSGRVVITDGDDRAETFGPGDTFVIPMGLKCTWHMPETTRKYYVILDGS